MFGGNMKRRRPFLFDLGGSFEEMIRDLERIFMEDFERLLENLEKENIEPGARVKRYGYMVRVGPDGKVYIKKFGDIPSEEIIEEQSSYKVPFTDVYEKDGNTYITVELPGVKEDEIKYRIKEGGLEIKTTGERKYKTFIPLSGKISEKDIEKNFNNGILEIIIKRNASK